MDIWDDDNFIEGKNNESFNIPCPACRSELFLKDSSLVVDQKEGFQLYHVDCSSCRSSCLIVVSPESENFWAKMSVVTDFTKEDLEDIKEKDSISADDVLEIHKTLEK